MPKSEDYAMLDVDVQARVGKSGCTITLAAGTVCRIEQFYNLGVIVTDEYGFTAFVGYDDCSPLDKWEAVEVIGYNAR